MKENGKILSELNGIVEVKYGNEIYKIWTVKLIKSYIIKYIKNKHLNSLIILYFPGYLRQEKHWLTYKGREMDGNTFSRMCAGAYKNAPTLADYD